MITRQANVDGQEFASFTYDIPAAIAATTTVKLMTIQRPFRVDKVEIDLPAGYTQDPTNYYNLDILNAALSAAAYSCLTGAPGGGTIAADTYTNFVLSATDTNRVIPAGTVMSFKATKVAAAANLPVGRVVIHGRYVG